MQGGSAEGRRPYGNGGTPCCREIFRERRDVTQPLSVSACGSIRQTISSMARVALAGRASEIWHDVQ